MPLNGILTNFYKYETNINAWGIARCIVCVGIRTEKPYKVVFYNLENFFDTQNDPDVLDDEFTPDGPKKWTQDKYDKSCII